MTLAMVDRPLRGIRPELYSRGLLYLVRDRFTGTTLVSQRLRLVAEWLSAGASRDDSVSASQLYVHAAADRVSGLLKHRWTVRRVHLDDADLLDKVEAVRRTSRRVVFLGDEIAFSFA